MQKKTLIIMGSSNSHGNTRKIINAVLKKTKADFIDLNNYEVSYFDYEHRNKADDFVKIATQMVQYEHIIFATPVYWYSMSAQLKTFFDRISDLLKIRKPLGRQLRGKKMYLISCSGDSEKIVGFTQPFINTADYLGMTFGGNLHGWIEEENEEISLEVLEQIDLFCELLG